MMEQDSKQIVRVRLNGGKPWGLRLSQADGGNSSIIISKIRKRSKAGLAALKEGDTLVSINGHDCNILTRDEAVTLIDVADDVLDIVVLRVEHNNNSLNGVRKPDFAGQNHREIRQSNGRQSTEINSSGNSGAGETPSKLDDERDNRKINKITHIFHQFQTKDPTIVDPIMTSQEKIPEESEKRAFRAYQTGASAFGGNFPEVKFKVHKVAQAKNSRWQPVSSTGAMNVKQDNGAREIDQNPVPPSESDQTANCKPVSPIPPPPPLPPPPLSLSSRQNNGVLDDPSLILKGVVETDKKSKNQNQPHSFLGYSNIYVEEEFRPSVEELKKMCKSISDMLLSPTENQSKAKGARMFSKRRERSESWTSKEATGLREDVYIEPMTPFTAIDEAEKKSSSFRPPPLPFANELKIKVMTSDAGEVYVEPTNFNINLKSQVKCRHDTITPEQTSMLVADLRSFKGRGGEMFARRQKRIEKYIIDETNIKVPEPLPPAPKKNKEEPALTLEYIARQKSRPGPVWKKTPWEAAQESPIGSVDSAFGQRYESQQIDDICSSVIDAAVEKQLPKPPASWLKTSTIVPQMSPPKLGEPAIRPSFKANAGPHNSAFSSATGPAVQGKFTLISPKFDARNMANDATRVDGKPLPLSNLGGDFNVKPKKWTSGPGSPASPASYESYDVIPGHSHQLPHTPPVQRSFNPKPRGWSSPSETQRYQIKTSKPNTACLESEDL